MSTLSTYTSAPFFGQKTLHHKRNSLAFAILGLFSKILNLDLSKLQFYGLALPPDNTSLIPGFLGLSLGYSMIMMTVYTAFDLKRRSIERDQLGNPEAVTDAVVVQFFPEFLRTYRSMPPEAAEHASKLVRDWAMSGFSDDFKSDSIDLVREFGRAKRMLSGFRAMMVDRSLSAINRYALFSYGFDLIITWFVALYASAFIWRDSMDVIRLFISF